MNTVYKNKMIIISCLLLSSGFLMAGCASGGTATNRLAANPVGAVLEEQIAKNEESLTGNPEGMETDAVISGDKEITANSADQGAQSPQSPDSISGALKDFAALTSMEVEKSTSEGVDYDLSEMSSDMVYASVYQLMNDPADFEGKVFRMEGIYYATYYEPTQQYYHYVIVEDAMACCAQGIEFIWGDGSHVYPDEYPENESRIMVEGTFETYQEENDARLFCRLKNATMVPVQ